MTEIVTDGTETGIIQFTVVPGVLSGYQLLMKPVVYTVKETESMNQGQDTVTEDHSTMVAQPSLLEANRGGGKGKGRECSSISNPT